MIIATYNLWDSSAGMPLRFGQILGEIRAVQADVLCLQEVDGPRMHQILSEGCLYPHAHYHHAAGVSILSRHPLRNPRDFHYASSALIDAPGHTLMVTNVHLPWNSALEKEQAITEIIRQTQDIPADYVLLAGDFNGSDQSSVHHFLKGDQSLLGCEAYFFDLAEAWAETTGTAPEATLNFRKNPRWGVINEKNTIEVSGRFDRIYLKNPYPQKHPILQRLSLFGTAVSEKTRLAASDHYGVCAQLEI